MSAKEKKNCHSCKHLEWAEGECMYGSDTGWSCNKRQADIDEREEIVLLAKLEKSDYRNRYKRCFEPKGTP